MKKLILPLLALITFSEGTFAAGLHLGMISAVKSQVNELNNKVVVNRIENGSTITGMLTGTAARGLAISSGVIELKDSRGVLKSTATDTDGKYAMDLTGLRAPIILKITDGATVYFSIAFSSGVCNITPISDLMVRSYFRINGGIDDLKTVFDNNFSSLGTLPTSDKIDAIRDIVTDIITPVFVRYGLDPAQFNVLTSTFETITSLFDIVLDDIEITIAGSTITIKDKFTGLTISTLTFITGGQHISVTKMYTQTLDLYTDANSPYNLLIARASGGNPPYTFMLETGVGFQPLGMELEQDGCDLYLKGIPSAGTESSFTRHFGVCVKDLGGNSATVTPRYDYNVSSTVVSAVGPSSITITSAAYTFVESYESIVVGYGNQICYVYDVTAQGTVTGPVGAEFSFFSNPTIGDKTASCPSWTATPVTYQMYKRGPSDPATSSWSGTWRNYEYKPGVSNASSYGVQINAYLFTGTPDANGLIADDSIDLGIPTVFE